MSNLTHDFLINEEFKNQIINHALDKLDNNLEGVYACDLHHELFNTDYFVIGYYDANKFIELYGGAWKAIHRIESYEKDMFVESYTDVSNCEKVANMLAYIYGELVLMECPHLQNVWEHKLTIEDINIIRDQLQDL